MGALSLLTHSPLRPDLGCESTCRLLSCTTTNPPLPFIIITQPESWYSTVPQRVEGWVDLMASGTASSQNCSTCSSGYVSVSAMMESTMTKGLKQQSNYWQRTTEAQAGLPRRLTGQTQYTPNRTVYLSSRVQFPGRSVDFTFRFRERTLRDLISWAGKQGSF